MLKHMELSIAKHLQKKKNKHFSSGTGIKQPLQIQRDNDNTGNHSTDCDDDEITSSTYAAAPSSSSRPSLPTMNCCSEAGFLLNSSITLSVGYFGVFGTNTVDDILSLQYPNFLLTPSPDGLIIWCILFVSQFLYIMVQSYRPYESQLVIKGVQYSFFWASIFQIGWVLSTSFDVIWLSMTFVTLCLLCATAIVIRQSVYLHQHYYYVQDLHELQQRREHRKALPSFFDNGSEADTTQNSGDETDDDTRETFRSLSRFSKLSNGRSPLQFWIVQFPFLAYCGLIWTIFLTMVQVVLVRYREEWEDWLSSSQEDNEEVDVIQVEYFIVLGCICFLGVIGILSLCCLHNGIIAMVWSWYLIGIYFELNAPAMALMERFPQATINSVRYEALWVGAGLLLVSVIACATRRSNPSPASPPAYPNKEANDDDDTARSSNDSNDSTTSYVRQEDIESQRDIDDQKKKKRPNIIGVIAPSSSDESLSRPYHI